MNFQVKINIIQFQKQAVRGIAVLFAIVFLIALAGYIIRSSNKQASNVLYVIAGILAVLLLLGLTRLA